MIAPSRRLFELTQHRQHRSRIVARSPSHSTAMRLRFCYDLCELVTLCTPSLRHRYDHGASAATVLFSHRQPWRFCYASTTLLLRFKRSGQRSRMFQIFPEVDVNLLDSMPTLSNMLGSFIMEMKNELSHLELSYK